MPDHHSITKRIKQVKHQLLCLLCMFLFANTYMAAQDASRQVDSLKNLLHSQQGKERYRIYQQLDSAYIQLDDFDTRMANFNEWVEYAHSQKDIEQESNARMVRMAAYTNANRLKDTKTPTWDEDLAFWREHELWDKYASVNVTYLQNLLLSGKMDEALNVAQEQYEFFKKKDLNYGIGAMAHIIGTIYYYQERTEECIDFLRESVQRLKKEKTSVQILEGYRTLSLILAIGGHTEEAEKWLNEWREVLEANFKDNVGAWFNYNINAAYVHMHMGDYGKAEEYIRKCEQMSPQLGDAVLSKYLTYSAWSQLYQLQKDYPNAIKALDSTRVYVENSAVTLEGYLRERAELAWNGGLHDIASEAWRELYFHNDSIQKTKIAAQVDELRTQYEVDKFKAEKKRNRNYFLFALTGCVLLFLLLGGTVYYNRIISKKNRGLYRRIKAQDRLAEELEQMRRHYEALSSSQSPAPAETEEISNEEAPLLPGNQQQRELVARLHEYLLNNQNFTKADINRESLLSALSTNKNVLTEAVKAVTGKKPMEYIREMQLEEARRMLDKHPELTVEAIALDCGFNTAHTFYRLFRKQYDISPAEYRKMAGTLEV